MRAMSLECGAHCPPGIYIGFSADGKTFHTTHLVSESLPTDRCRTSNVPVHGLEWGDKGFRYYEHENVEDRVRPNNTVGLRSEVAPVSPRVPLSPLP